jgi:hypothetical protein
VGDKMKKKNVLIEPTYTKGDYTIINGCKWVIEEVKEVGGLAYSITWTKEKVND